MQTIENLSQHLFAIQLFPISRPCFKFNVELFLIHTYSFVTYSHVLLADTCYLIHLIRATISRNTYLPGTLFVISSRPIDSVYRRTKIDRACFDYANCSNINKNRAAQDSSRINWLPECVHRATLNYCVPILVILIQFYLCPYGWQPGHDYFLNFDCTAVFSRDLVVRKRRKRRIDRAMERVDSTAIRTYSVLCNVDLTIR